MYEHQTRKESLIETCINVGLGFIVSFCAWPFVATAFGYPYDIIHNLGITAIFTGLSVARGYIVRRFFAAHLHNLVRRLTSDNN